MAAFVLTLCSFLVGLSIGICGVAGFLLPLLFVGYAGYGASDSLFLSFGCFLISGAIGAATYYRRGDMPLKIGLPLGLSSLSGGLAGAFAGKLFVGGAIKTVLYVVVLVSGLMIFAQEYLLRKKAAEKRDTAGAGQLEKEAVPKTGLLILLGFVTAVICSLSGAGGPVVVMPLLVLLGVQPRKAVGIALFDSIFIAIPAIFVYGSAEAFANIGAVFALVLAGHTAGIVLGSLEAHRIPQQALKRGVAVFSIVFALWKLLG